MNTENQELALPEGHVLAEEVALQEVAAFIKHHTKKTLKDDDIKEQYEDILLAVQLGNLCLANADSPSFKLTETVSTDQGGIAYETINFKTRMKPLQRENIFRGIDPQKDRMKIVNASTAFFCHVAVTKELDSFGKFDIKVMEQLCSLFM